jgi:hypothetical protein
VILALGINCCSVDSCLATSICLLVREVLVLVMQQLTTGKRGESSDPCSDCGRLFLLPPQNLNLVQIFCEKQIFILS